MILVRIGVRMCKWEDIIRMNVREMDTEVVLLELAGLCYRLMSGYCKQCKEGLGYAKSLHFLDEVYIQQLFKECSLIRRKVIITGLILFLIFICPRIVILLIPNYRQEDATFLDLFISTDALHVSGGSTAHHQEHITVHTASGNT